MSSTLCRTTTVLLRKEMIFQCYNQGNKQKDQGLFSSLHVAGNPDLTGDCWTKFRNCMRRKLLDLNSRANFRMQWHSKATVSTSQLSQRITILSSIQDFTNASTHLSLLTWFLNEATLVDFLPRLDKREYRPTCRRARETTWRMATFHFSLEEFYTTKKNR